MLHSHFRHRNGFALVLVLSFIALLLVVALAFFSYSILQRQISNSSANLGKVDLFAQGALDTTVCDLQQEMVAGSTSTLVTTGSATTTLYAPTLSSPATGQYPSMVPYPVPTQTPTSSPPLPNLVKESLYNLPFYSGTPYTTTGPSRAANSLTTTSSLNNRSVSLPRWNEPLLLPRKNPGLTSTDLTPITTFTAPNWIYVDTSGNNPTTIPSATSPPIVGRYAYCIYDEGGLLNMNVAGYPVETTSATASHKIGTSFADLTSFLDPTTGTPGSPYLSQVQVDQLLGWRNYATAQPTSTGYPTPSTSTSTFPSFSFNSNSITNYFNTVFGDTTGFMTTANTALYNNLSDQKFTSRQQLIDFVTQTLGASPDALQYFGTFSRTLDQPSIWPDANRPRVVGLATLPTNPSNPTTTFPNNSEVGGNNAYGLDDQVNPSFLQVPVTTSFTRNDGTTAVVGEPLVKKRFGLNRLAWLTYKGPSATVYAANPNDPIILALLNQGISQQMITSGTPTNIYNYFGLTWQLANLPNSTISTTNYCWVYNHGISARVIGRLSDVQGLSSPREADFFELLKAAIPVGCLGKGAASNHGTSTNLPNLVDVNQYNLDTNTDFQILQIGANIEDQFDSDSYPTHIQYYDTSASVWRDFYGDENLPGLYRVRGIGITEYPTTNAVQLMLPEVWNPHDPNSNPPSAGPTSFRFILSSSSSVAAQGQTRIYNYAGSSINPPGVGPVGASVTLDANPPVANGVTEIDFSIPLVTSNPSYYYEPLFLGGVKVQNSSSLYSSLTASQITAVSAHSIGSTGTLNYLNTSPYNTSVFGGSGGFITDAVSGLSYGGVVLGQFLNSWSNSSQSWSNLTSLTSGTTTPSILPLVPPTYNYFNPAPCDQCKLASLTLADYILQYQDASGNWNTYEDNYSAIPTACSTSPKRASGTGTTANPAGRPSEVDISDVLTGSSPTIDSLEWISWMDPRTSRFGSFDCGYSRTSNPEVMSFASYYGESNRPDTTFGLGLYQSAPGTGLSSPTVSSNAPTIGWYPGSWGINPNAGQNVFVPAYYSENVTGTRPAPQSNANFFTDPDGVVRRGMGAYTSAVPSSTVGLPMALLSTSTTQSQSRPFILNRPFRSVAELGYTFSGTPWRNLDFFTPESGFASLLDVFCISETSNTNAMVDGKVDLNTRQVPVLKAILSGTSNQGYAYKDELNAGGTGTTASLSSTEVASIAQALINRTTSTTAGEGPLRNVSELVGKWNATVKVSGATAPHNIDGSQSYTGFSTDLTTIFDTSDTTLSSSNIQRLRESAMRALSAAGQTRVWNLMIDLVAQTGRYKSGETSLDNFLVDGEQRYWLHIAIDRYTGKIIDEQLELVKE